MVLALLMACRPPATSPTTVDTGSPTPPTPTGPNLAASEDFAELAGLDCAEFTACAPTEEPWLGETCCAYGDALARVRFDDHIEAVDVAVNDDFVVSCSGFGGAFAAHGGDFEGFGLRALGNGRCQRIGFGPELPEGQVIYVAHHGDSWVPEPALWTYAVRSDGTFDVLDEKREGHLYEGIAVTDTHLYVAAHGGGVRIYSLDDGVPDPKGGLTGFVNAVDLRVEGDRLYVLDSEQLRIYDLANPDQPGIVGAVPLSRTGRDLDIVGDRLYVALGPGGLEVFDRTNRDAPVSIERIAMDGSTQAVKANAERIAVANWNHIAVLDPDTLRVVATEKTVQQFEQDLGIAVLDEHVIAAEWSGIYAFRHQPGFVAPDLWVEEDIFTFPSGEATTRDVFVTNRGPLWLEVWQVETTEQFTATPESFELAPGESTLVEVTYTPPTPFGQSWMDLVGNDPDPWDHPRRVRLSAAQTGLIGIGDAITEDFGFLDPTGNGDVAALEGKVVVLAYFALF